MPSPLKSPATIASGRSRRCALTPEVMSTRAGTSRRRCPSGSRPALLLSLVHDSQVELAVAAEITRRDRIGVEPDGVIDRGLERPVAVAHQDQDAAEPAKRRSRRRGRGCRRRWKSPTAIAFGARPDRVVTAGWNVPSPLPIRIETVSKLVDGEVEDAVAAEIPHRDRDGAVRPRNWPGAGKSRHRCPSGSRPADRPGDGQVEDAVAAEISRRDATGCRPVDRLERRLGRHHHRRQRERAPAALPWTRSE